VGGRLGRISEGGPLSPTALRQVELGYLGSNGQCNSLTNHATVTANQFCLGFLTGGADSCNSDSGSPAYFRFAGALKQLGLVSEGVGCARPNLPGIYARISGFRNWILGQVPTTGGSLHTFRTNAAAAPSVLNTNPNQSTRWDLMAVGEFGRTTHSDVVRYDRTAGTISISTSDAAGRLSSLRTTSGILPNYTSLVAGDFGSTATDDLFAYDPVRGEATFWSTDGQGTLTPIRTATGFFKTWRMFLPANFNGDGWTDLLAYDPSRGVGRFYTTNGAGVLTNIRDYTTWAKDWSIIVPGQFTGSALTDLLFYNAQTGLLRVHRVDAAGAMTLVYENRAFPKNVQYIVPGEFGGAAAGFTDIYTYDPTSGVGVFYASSGTGSLTEIRRHTTRLTWSNVLAGNFNGAGTTDIAFYERFRP
jgi:hypothetical protein